MQELILRTREAKTDLEYVRNRLQDAGALSKVQLAVRALAAVDELIYSLEDGERASARTLFRDQWREAPARETGPGQGPDRGPE